MGSPEQYTRQSVRRAANRTDFSLDLSPKVRNHDEPLRVAKDGEIKFEEPSKYEKNFLTSMAKDPALLMSTDMFKQRLEKAEEAYEQEAILQEFQRTALRFAWHQADKMYDLENHALREIRTNALERRLQEAVKSQLTELSALRDRVLALEGRSLDTDTQNKVDETILDMFPQYYTPELFIMDQRQKELLNQIVQARLQMILTDRRGAGNFEDAEAKMQKLKEELKRLTDEAEKTADNMQRLRKDKAAAEKTCEDLQAEIRKLKGSGAGALKEAEDRIKSLEEEARQLRKETGDEIRSLKKRVQAQDDRLKEMDKLRLFVEELKLCLTISQSMLNQSMTFEKDIFVRIKHDAEAGKLKVGDQMLEGLGKRFEEISDLHKKVTATNLLLVKEKGPGRPELIDLYHTVENYAAAYMGPMPECDTVGQVSDGDLTDEEEIKNSKLRAQVRSKSNIVVGYLEKFSKDGQTAANDGHKTIQSAASPEAKVVGDPNAASRVAELEAMMAGMKDKLQEAERKLSAHEAEAEKMRKEKEAAERRAKEAEARVSQLQQEVETARRLTGSDGSAEELLALQQQMEEKEKVWAQERQSLEDRIADLEKRLDDMRKARAGDSAGAELLAMEKRLLQLEEELEEERKQRMSLSDLANELKNQLSGSVLKEEYDRLKAEVAANLARTKALEAEIAALQKENGELQIQMAELEDRLRTLKELAEQQGWGDKLTGALTALGIDGITSKARRQARDVWRRLYMDFFERLDRLEKLREAAHHQQLQEAAAQSPEALRATMLMAASQTHPGFALVQGPVPAYTLSTMFSAVAQASHLPPAAPGSSKKEKKSPASAPKKLRSPSPDYSEDALRLDVTSSSVFAMHRQMEYTIGGSTIRHGSQARSRSQSRSPSPNREPPDAAARSYSGPQGVWSPPPWGSPVKDRMDEAHRMDARLGKAPQQVAMQKRTAWEGQRSMGATMRTVEESPQDKETLTLWPVLGPPVGAMSPPAESPPRIEQRSPQRVRSPQYRLARNESAPNLDRQDRQLQPLSGSAVQFYLPPVGGTARNLTHTRSARDFHKS